MIAATTRARFRPPPAPDRIPQGRQAIEDMIERLIQRLDAMDADADMEPDVDGEEEAEETTLQPRSLAPSFLPAKVRRRA
jgi:hypothetical protein